MKSFIRHSFAVLLAAIFVASAAGEARAQGVLGAILKRMDMYNKSLQSLQADVTMVKYNPQLGVSDTSVGSTSYLPKAGNRPMYVRIDWTKPVQEQMAAIGDSYEIFRPRLNQVIEGKIDKAKNNAAAGGALSFMNMGREQLKANYNIEFVAEENLRDAKGTATWHLLLTPKSPTSYKSADLWVDKDGTPRQAKITEKNNDSTTVLLENIKKNLSLSASIFKLKYPGNVKKVRA
jgi:outer membrane lipoprotein-sorting protein